MHSLVLCAIFGVHARGSRSWSPRAARSRRRRSRSPGWAGLRRSCAAGTRRHRRGRAGGRARDPARPPHELGRGRSSSAQRSARSSCRAAACGALGDDAREQGARSTGRAGTSRAAGRRRRRPVRLGLELRRHPASRRKTTVVLRIDGPSGRTTGGPRRSTSSRDDHWFEDLFWLDQVDSTARALQLPSWCRARRRPARVDRAAACGSRRSSTITSRRRGRRSGSTPTGSGRVPPLGRRSARPRPDRARAELPVWSYAPDPAPRALASAPLRYPPATRALPRDRRPARSRPSARRTATRAVRRVLRRPVVRPARSRSDASTRSRGASPAAPTTPYGAVLALESWLRQTGGFRYDESPPHTTGPPLVAFLTQTKAGYCQHFAGAMAVMLRLLGIPSRVAVGFTSGREQHGDVGRHRSRRPCVGRGLVPGLGWIPFDPTPGRGTFGGDYSFASSSDAAVAALRRGDLSQRRDAGPNRARRTSSDLRTAGRSRAAARRRSSASGSSARALWVAPRRRRQGGAYDGARYLSRDPRRVATASRRELEGFLRDQGVAHSSRARRSSTSSGRSTASSASTGGPSPARSPGRATGRRHPEQRAARAKTELRGLLTRSARRDLSLWARLRGFASLRSLRSAGTP